VEIGLGTRPLIRGVCRVLVGPAVIPAAWPGDWHRCARDTPRV